MVKQQQLKCEERFYLIKLYNIELTLDELEHLDGKVSEKAQKVIDAAKKESSYGFDLPVMNEILRKSEEIGKLTWTSKNIRSCSYCDKKNDYQAYPRTTKYHNKGEKNYDKPIYYSGIEFNQGFVILQGFGDMCWGCCKKNNVIERLVRYTLENNLPIQIQKNEFCTSKYLKDNIRTCFECNNEMQESQMGKSPTVMGDGYYPSTCPHCGAISKPFGANHGTTKKFAMIENPEAKAEIEELKVKIKEYNTNKNDEDGADMYVSKHNHNVIIVKARKWMNGYKNWLTIDTKHKQYEKDYFYPNECNFEELLIRSGYEKKK